MPIDATQNNAIISIYLVGLLVPTGKTSLSTISMSYCLANSLV